MINWEDKENVDKTWLRCQSYYTKPYTKHKRYNNTKAKICGFESTENIGKAWMKSDDDIRSFLEGIEEAMRADKDHIQHISVTINTMVDIFQHQVGSSLYQHKHILKLMENFKHLPK